MKSAFQPSLFESEFPRSLECSGAELGALLADLKARGAVVLGMASVCVSRWRLSLDWPIQKPATRFESRA
jgi:hypothetical protein